MNDTTAVPEYCAHCGLRLGSQRVIIAGQDTKLHPDCVDAWKYKKAVRDAWREDTSSTPWRSP